MLKKEHELLVPFLVSPWRKFTFREIKKAANKSSESYTYDGLKKFVKESIINEEKAGNVTLYSANLEYMKAQAYFGFIAEYRTWGKRYIPYKNLQNVFSKTPTSFFTIIITGSYAHNTQKSTSDIDVVIIIDNAAETKKVYGELKYECEMCIPKIHLYVFTESEFLEMLLNKEANYGKAVAGNNLILCGGQNYYKVIKEAIKHGFNDKNLS